MFAVKFINEFHANYLHFGKNEVGDATGILGSSEYKTNYVEHNADPVTLVTSARKEVTATLRFKTDQMPDDAAYNLTLAFDDSNSCTISGTYTHERTDGGVTYTTVFETVGDGKAQFVSKQKDSYTSWGNKDRDVINNLNYKVVVASTDDPEVDPDLYYKAEETMVVRTRDMTVETYTPVVTP